MLLDQALSNCMAEVKLLNFRVEDEGCPHIIFSVHTPINFFHSPPLASLETMNIHAQVFITGAEQFAIDGSFIDVNEVFNFTYFLQLINNGSTTIDSYLDAFKTKLKLQLFGIAESNDLNSSDESDLYWQCVDGSANINEIEIINNATRAVVLIDEAVKNFKDYLINLTNVTQAH